MRHDTLYHLLYYAANFSFLKLFYQHVINDKMPHLINIHPPETSHGYIHAYGTYGHIPQPPSDHGTDATVRICQKAGL